MVLSFDPDANILLDIVHRQLITDLCSEKEPICSKELLNIYILILVPTAANKGHLYLNIAGIFLLLRYQLFLELFSDISHLLLFL